MFMGLDIVLKFMPYALIVWYEFCFQICSSTIFIGATMKEEIVKKNWEKPELIAIVRCRTEECVLAACKVNARVCGRESGPTLQLASS
jgi:hypothetical protein